MSELQIERVGDLSGGRNSRASEFLVGNNESPDDLNLVAKTVGAIQRRDGSQELFGAAVSSHPVLGLHAFYKSDGSKYIIFGTGDELWYYDKDANTQTRISTGFDMCQPWSFATFQDWCYCSNFADIPYRWDGTNLRAVGLNAPTFSGALAAAGADGFLSNGTYYYRITADYGALGESNLSAEALTIAAAAANHVDIPDQTANLPTGAVGFKLYRTLVNPPSNPDLRVYYLVDSFSSTYTDTTADNALLVEYPGDRATPYNAAFLAAHNNRMWYGYLQERDNSVAYPSRVAYSALYQPDILGDAAVDTGFIDIYPNDGDAITGIRPLRGNLVVFKRHKIYQILGTSIRDFEVRDTHSDVGCMAPMSIANVNNKLFFLSEKGVYYFDGQGTVRVSDNIDLDIRSLTSDSKVWAFGGSHRNRYYLSVSA